MNFAFFRSAFSFAAMLTARLRTWHDDGAVRFKGLRVDLDGRHGVVTGVSIQQVALET